MRSYAEDSVAAGRHILPDLTRAWALFGIAVVNVGVFAWPMASSYHNEGGLTGPVDQAAFWAVNAFFLMKSYSLFSLMFGVGFAYQMESASRRGVGFAGRYWRRIAGLFAFGLLNIAFLFFGDILFLYAILGSVLFLFRKAGAKTLLRWAIGVYAVQFLVVAGIAFGIYMGSVHAPEEMAKGFADMAAMDDGAREAFGSGSFWDATVFRLGTYFGGLPFLFMMQGLGAFAFFLFGFAAVRSGVIANPSAPVWKRARRIALPVGVVISGIGGWLMVIASSMMNPLMMLGLALVTLGSPFSSFGYVGLIAKWAEGRGGPVRTFFARGGTASLTAYLMQGLILSLVFSAYGLGFFAQLPAALCIAIAAGVALLTIAFASLWRLAFQRGPTEMVLRNWTYLGAR